MPDTIVVHTKCPFCLLHSNINVPAEGYQDWLDGALIQNALPELSASARELLITGICDTCFPSSPEN